MKRYMIVAIVNGERFLTNVEAESACSAEHTVLDRGICGKHDYGVSACMAYDLDAMQTETFRYDALFANPVSLAELNGIIEKRNEEIRAKGAAEQRLAEIEKERREITERLEMLRAEGKEALALLNG